MNMNETQAPVTLGPFVRQARERAGLSLRNLEAITGIPRAKLNRLEHDQRIEHEADVLQRVAEAPELNSDDLFAFVGYRPSETLPSLTPYLRAKYHLPPKALAAASEALREILDKYEREHGTG
jgi:transcriptional regulator with XRE-family HTH domain